jgi:hypothetical protein
VCNIGASFLCVHNSLTANPHKQRKIFLLDPPLHANGSCSEEDLTAGVSFKIITRKVIVQPQSQLPTFMSRFIYSQDRSTYLAAAK